MLLQSDVAESEMYAPDPRQCQQPENVMLLSRNRPQLKLIDFGLSRRIEHGKDQRHMLGKIRYTADSAEFSLLLLRHFCCHGKSH